MNLGIITSSVVDPNDDKRRMDSLDEWATTLVGGFALCGISASLTHNLQDEPLGFAYGMNCALHDLLLQHSVPDYVLCINDDMHMPQKCIDELWKHRQEHLVVCPTTDYTSCPEQAATGPRFESPRRAAFVPAICWLMPMVMVMIAWRKLGKVENRRQLFAERLGRAWYEDNLTARIWQKLSDPLPFLIAPTAWAHHEGSRTSNAIPVEERAQAGLRFEGMCLELGL